MHVIFRESHGLEETETPQDVGQTPADLVVLSFSDSDLGAFAEGWRRGGGAEGRIPSLRLANLAQLKHPLSVDTYVEQTLSGAKGVLIRLIGGVPYWSYGLQQVRALAQARGLAVAVLPADGRVDERLDAFSTLPVSTLRRLAHLCDTGGTVAAQAALAQMAMASGLYAGPVIGAKALPSVGCWTPAQGVTCPVLGLADGRPRVALVFYRSYLVAADLGPMRAIVAEFEGRGFAVTAYFVPSLKAPEAAGWLRRQLVGLQPAAVLNATAFSGKGTDGTSPLDACGAPVFQCVLATSTRAAWEAADRGLSPSDLAMHVVLPEVDGNILGEVVSFKEATPRDPDLQFTRMAHVAHEDRVTALADRVMARLRLAATSQAERRVALVLSTYPGKDWQAGHAVGLDAPESARAILSDLRDAGYAVGDEPERLSEALLAGGLSWPVEAYRAALERVPEALRAELDAAWGPVETDTLVTEGAFRFRALRCGKAVVALQPERGTVDARADDYHDLSRVPCHGYVAFYLWLQAQADALIHIGAHGTLEWLPGKSVALSGACWPRVLLGTMPVLYPFIVNDPGEAAQAKRRLGALTLGHVPPPLVTAGSSDRLALLEALLDEFSNADGLDPRRRDRLQADIRAEAQALGVEDDLGLERATSTAEAITRIDRFVCDVKESQFGEGLHVWGRAGQELSSKALEAEDLSAKGLGVREVVASAEAEKRSILDALDGRRIAPGPSGSPYRGRADVLPTGRNLFTTDPRSVPTRAAYAQGVTLAEELVRRHLQDEGDWPRALVVDLWGSQTMRTAGEEFAMALHLMGVKPVWDKGSERVSGIEVLPLAELHRPRLDVTLRVSGLFRDVFPVLSALFAQAVRVLAARDEAADWNPFVGRSDLARVYGPKPGAFGLGMGAALEEYSDAGRRAAGEAWLAASSWALDGDAVALDAEGLRDRVAGADSFVHLHDLAESDLLLAMDFAAHEGGFAAAQAVAGGQAALYHLDNTDPSRPRARSLPEEIARVVRARATNPRWIDGMKPHGFRGAAEIAATLEHMAGFAHLARAVPSHLFDAYYEATLGDAAVVAFLRAENPAALVAMQDRFRALQEAGLWVTRRNSILAEMEGLR